MSGVSGDFSELLANDNVDGQLVVDILDTDVAFKSERCGRIVPYAAPAAPASTFGEGNWVVNEQISPGRYQSAGAGSCYWERISDFSGGMGTILANDNVDGSTVVDILPDDVGFNSARCGTWTLVG